MSLGLTLHCGAQEIERKAVNSFEAPPAIETPRIDKKTGKAKGTSVWQPIDHELLTRYTEMQLINQGFKIGEQQFAVTPDGAKFFGLMEIIGDNLDGNGPTEKGYKRLLGLRNSFDKTITAGLACGAKVFVCDNLSFSGEIVAKHKHTKNIMTKLPGMITQAISKMTEAFNFQDRRITAYQNEEFDQWKLADTVIELIRNKAIPAGRAVAVCDEYLKPSHDHGMDSKVWNLFNAATQVLKQEPQQRMVTQTIKLHEHLDKVCNVPWVDVTEHDRVQKEIDQEREQEKANGNNEPLELGFDPNKVLEER